MKTVINYPTDTSVRVEFTLEPSDLSDANLVALKFLGKETKVQGFRKGKAPVSILSKHIDPTKLHDKTIDVAINKAIGTCFIENNLHALDRPQVDFKKYVPGEILEFTADVEVLPKVELGNYKKLKVEIKPRTIAKKDVDDVIKRMQEGMAEKEAVEREAKDGDETIIDFVGKKDGVAFAGGTASDYSLTIGSKTFIPGFEEGIIGKKPGETFDLELKFPKNYHAEELKGADVVFTTTLKKVHQKKLPELNDDFAKKVGPFETVKDLEVDIKRELNEQAKREAQEKIKDALVTELVKISKVPVPKILIEDQVESLKRDFMNNLMYQGLNLDQYLKSQGFNDEADWRKKELEPEAEKRVKAGLVLAQLSKEFKTEVTETEIDKQIAQFKTQYQKDPSFASRFDNEEARRDVANRLMTEKTIEELLSVNSANN